MAASSALHIEAFEQFNPRLMVVMAVLAVMLFAGLLLLELLGAFGISGGLTVVLAIRLFVPLLILRWWLVGGVLALVADAVDVIITDLLGMGGFGDHYAEIDKALDAYYFVFQLLVALGWRNPWMRLPAIAFFAYRLVGSVLFEATGDRIYLFIFANLFENWWLYCVVVMKWFPRLVPNDFRAVAIPAVLLLLPKVAQEYLLHYAEATPWRWSKEHILDPLGVNFWD